MIDGEENNLDSTNVVSQERREEEEDSHRRHASSPIPTDDGVPPPESRPPKGTKPRTLLPNNQARPHRAVASVVDKASQAPSALSPRDPPFDSNRNSSAYDPASLLSHANPKSEASPSSTTVTGGLAKTSSTKTTTATNPTNAISSHATPTRVRSPPKVTPPTGAIESPVSPTTPHSIGTASSTHSYEAATGSAATSVNRKRGVPHIYRDYSAASDATGFVRKKTGGVTQPFPEKLHELLERENVPTIISWLPHGRAFLVRKPKEFTQGIMPSYFRQTKLTSFQRQLNLYGFRRITQGADAGAYYHELFLRGRPQLCMRMRRQKVKGTGHKQPADAQTEPNFYSMPSSRAQPHGEPASPETQMTVAPEPCEPEDEEPALPPSSQQRQPSYEEMSPGLQGLHGAAHLLKGIAAGLPASSLDKSIPFSLGASGAPRTSDASYQASAMSSSSGSSSQQQPTLVPFTTKTPIPTPKSSDKQNLFTNSTKPAASYTSRFAASSNAVAPTATPSSIFWSNSLTGSATTTTSTAYESPHRTPHGFLTTTDESTDGTPTKSEAV